MGEQPPDDAALPLHRVEVPVAVAPPDREPGNEVVQHEVVQDDETRCPPQRLDDPAVRVGIVADVVDAEIDTARRPLAPRLTTSTSQRSRSAGTSSAE